MDEALRLMRMSKMSLYEDAGTSAEADPVLAVYAAIRDNAVASGKRTYAWPDLVTLLGRSFSVRAFVLQLHPVGHSSVIIYILLALP